MPTTWTIQTPTTAPGAIAVIQLHASTARELDETLRRLGIGAIPVGAASLRDLFSIDTGIVARWTGTTIHLMPHGGVGVIRAISRALFDAGLAEARELDPRAAYPEAASLIEARTLRALALAASPLAIDLLLDQPRRWGARSDHDAALDITLNHLIEPPLIAAIGPPNIGKSSLVNTLAGRAVAIVADEPGTTRDHLGVMLDLGGLVVRYLDTPGMRQTRDDIESEAQRLALAAAASADLILLMGDSTSPPIAYSGPGRILRVAMRSDLGMPAWTFEVAVSARTGQGIPTLVAAIRDALIPPASLQDPRPWRFWSDSLPG